MSRLMTGSGKFVSVVSEYSSAQQPTADIVDPNVKLAKDTNSTNGDNPPLDVIPPTPKNPDARPMFIQYAEEYFGKYWVLTLVLLIIVLFRKK